ncbi:MAG: PAS domain S-box protein [Deltaproteobacteria bacterium]
MTAKLKKDRIEQILNSLKKAAAGDYSQKLDFASREDDLGLIADAVNKLLRKTEKKLSSSRQTAADLTDDARRYRHILDNIEESYFEVDLQGNLFFFNDTVVRDLGYSPEELRGINFQKLVDEANAKKVYEAFHQVFLSNRPIKGFDWEILKKNREKIDVESSVALLHDESGKPVGFRGVVRNISQRVQAQNDLRQSEEKYRTILDIMDEGYLEQDLSGRITFANDAACRLMRYERDQLIGRHYRNYLIPGVARMMKEVFQTIYATGKPERLVDYDLVRPDGSVVTYEINGALRRDASGQLCGFRILMRDVTLRKQALEAKRLSEEKYRNILESMDETYLETDLKGNFLFFNDALCRVLGYSREELQNANYRLIIPPGQASSIFTMFNEIYRTGQKKTFVNHEIITRDGSTIFLEMSISLMRSPEGEPIGFSGISRDVTSKFKIEQAIKDRERRLRLITDNIRDIIWTMDFNLRWTYLSPSVLRITGFSPEEVMGIPLKAMMPPETYTLIEQTVAAELSREARGPDPDEPRTTTFEMPLMRKNGTNLWVEISADFSRDENGKPLEIVGVTRDISERRKTEEALKESEVLYRKALETTSDGVSILQNDKYVYVNPRFLKTLGIPENDPIGKSLDVMMHPDDAKLINYYHEKRLRGEPTPGKHEVRVIKPDQTLLYLEVTSVDIVYQGKPAVLNFMRDITQLKQAENTLRESEKRYRVMTENVNDIVWIINFDLQITYVSPSNIRLTGYAPEEVLYKPLGGLVAPESLALAARILADELVRETGGQPVDPNRSISLQIQVYSRLGENLWLEVNATFNRDASGKPTEILAVGRNITQRRNMEKALAESERRYRMIVENMHDSISIVGLDLQYIYQSPSEIRVTGYTPEEIMAIPIRDQLTQESYALAEEILARELELEFGDQPPDPDRLITLELEAYHKNGGTIWEEINAVFERDESGKPISIILTSRDITARKNAERALAESERRYRVMAENINDIIWTINLDLQITRVSPSCERVTGYTQEETCRTPLDQLLTPESFAAATRRLADEMALEATGQPFDPNRAITMEIGALHQTGRALWLEITGTFNRNSHGEITEILVVGRDITERKKAEQALAESEKLYRMIVENMQDVIWIMDFNLQYKYRSPSSMRITGYTADELMSRPVRDQITPESFARGEKILMEELALEQSGLPLNPHRARTLELEVYKNDGGTAWIEVTATFNRDQNGQPFEILLAARDVTTRRKIEDALRESERRYRMIVENMQDVIGIMDFNFQFTYVSSDNLKLTGYTKEEVKGVPIDKLLAPKSLSQIIDIFGEEMEREKKRTAFHDPVMRTIELELFHKAGGTTWAEVTATLTRDEYGKPKEIMLVARDITARREIQEALKESEQRYRMIVENMQEVIWTSDLNMKTTYMSPSCFLLTGYTPDELMDLPLDRLLTPESLTVAVTTVMEEIAREASGEPVDPYRSRTMQQEIIGKQGGTVWIEVTGTFIRDKQGKATGMLMAGRDITAGKKAEEEKDKLEAQLMQAQKMEIVGRLAGGVAHDFNNMLSVILGYVDLAKLRLAKQHPVLKDIAEIEKAAIRSRDITTQLLAFSRKQIIEPRIIDLNDLVAHTEKALVRLIGEDVNLQVKPGKNLWLIKFDPSQIEQILINLAVNARDAMSSGGRLIIETANIVLDDAYCEQHIDFLPGHYVRLSFSDNGAGMDKETLQYIFEPFFTTKEIGKGTGLGLATVYGIVKQNNGFINVYSERRHGTTFTIYLPRASEERDIQDEPEDEQAFTGTGNILLVEDDAMVLQITRGILESIGYTVMTTQHPQDAIAHCQNPASRIDLVISDVVMPGMSGKELRKKMLEIRPDIKVIFMSGYTADIIAQHGILEEGVQFIQKPFTVKSLASKVAEVMASGST